MNPWIAFILVLVMVAVVCGVVSSRRFNYIGVFHLRPCQGRQWKRTFPDARNEEIRRFLLCLVEGMDFEREDLLKFRPEDDVIAIYRSHYGGETPRCDEMECERFVMALADSFQVSEERICAAWSDESVTLGELFRVIRESRGR